MPDSFWQGTTDGVTTVYAVPFPYIEQSDVFVQFNGVTFYVVADYQWIGPASIQVNRVVPAGNTVSIARQTSPDGPLVTFQNGANLTGADLNTAVLQAFYRTQELQDQLNVYINAGVAKFSVTGANPFTTPQELLDAAAAAALDSELAQTLLNAASDITLNAQSILAQTTRVDTLQSAVDALTAGIPGGIGTFLLDEQTARVDGDLALQSTFDLMGAISGGGLTFTLDTSTVMVDGTTSMADKFSGLQSSITSNLATLTSEITTEATTRATADSTNASLISGITSTFTAGLATTNGNVTANAAAIATEATTRASADSANATSITSLTTVVSGHTSSISSQLSSINGLQAQFTLRIDADGNVAGFGLAAGGGSPSEFTVLANRFSVIDPGAPGGTPIVPFTISGGVVFMQNVVIGDALISNLNIGKLNTGTFNANMNIGTGLIIGDNGSHMRVFGVDFGTSSQFIDWYGPHLTSASSCDESNAIMYLRNDGTAYFGGELHLAVVHAFTNTSGTETVPAGYTNCIIEVSGGSGPGGHGASTFEVGGGGGAGGYVKTIVAVQSGQTFSVTAGGIATQSQVVSSGLITTMTAGPGTIGTDATTSSNGAGGGGGSAIGGNLANVPGLAGNTGGPGGRGQCGMYHIAPDGGEGGIGSSSTLKGLGAPGQVTFYYF